MENQIQLQLQFFCIINYNYVIGPGSDRHHSFFYFYAINDSNIADVYFRCVEPIDILHITHLDKLHVNVIQYNIG